MNSNMKPLSILLLAIYLVVAACSISGCANKEDTNNLIDVLSLPFKLIGM